MDSRGPHPCVSNCPHQTGRRKEATSTRRLFIEEEQKRRLSPENLLIKSRPLIFESKFPLRNIHTYVRTMRSCLSSHFVRLPIINELDWVVRKCSLEKKVSLSTEATRGQLAHSVLLYFFSLRHDRHSQKRGSHWKIYCLSTQRAFEKKKKQVFSPCKSFFSLLASGWSHDTYVEETSAYSPNEALEKTEAKLTSDIRSAY